MERKEKNFDLKEEISLGINNKICAFWGAQILIKRLLVFLLFLAQRSSLHSLRVYSVAIFFVGARIDIQDVRAFTHFLDFERSFSFLFYF